VLGHVLICLVERLTIPFPLLSSSPQGRDGQQVMKMDAGDVGGSGIGIVMRGMQVRMHHVLVWCSCYRSCGGGRGVLGHVMIGRSRISPLLSLLLSSSHRLKADVTA
jgi:hypothetical protein